MGGLLFALFVLGLIVAFYVFYCYCLKMICEKAGHSPGVLIWIPLLQMVPLLEVAGLPVWAIIGFFIPLVNMVLPIIMWVNVCKARGKGIGSMLLVILLPIVGVPYLAFSD